MPSTLLLSAYFPVVLLIWLMTKRRGVPSHIALPVTATATYVLCIWVFSFSTREVNANVILGALMALTPVLIIGSAILLFKVMDKTGAMTVIKHHLNQVSGNPVAQLVIVGWAFPFLIEGASGFGTPAALAAPILVGLGFPPLRVAVLVLVMNSVPVSFGAVGTPTWFGFAPLGLSEQDQLSIGIASAMIHTVCAFVIPVFALRALVSWQDINANLPYIGMSVAATVLPFLCVSFFSYEFPALVGGTCGLFVSVWLAGKHIGLSKSTSRMSTDPVLTHNDRQSTEALSTSMPLIKATFPLWGTFLVLVITRLPFFPLKTWLTDSESHLLVHLGELGDLSANAFGVIQWSNIIGTSVNWTLASLYIPAIVPFWLVSAIMLLACPRPINLAREVVVDTLKQMKLPLIALTAALVFVTMMMMGGDQSPVRLIGLHLADTLGGAWLFFAPVLGALGSFFSGSATISNLTFGAIQWEVAMRVGLPYQLVLAQQSVGAALGNMICINNIVAVASVLGLKNAEGDILRYTVKPMVVYACLAGVIGVASSLAMR